MQVLPGHPLAERERWAETVTGENFLWRREIIDAERDPKWERERETHTGLMQVLPGRRLADPILEC